MTPSSPLLAVGLANPVLLSGLGLVALPIIIHLLSRRQFRRIDWAATRFLLEADRENRRRRRFEQWLLVALRCLAMALLALLVARPFVRPGLVASLLGGRGQVQRVILIDDSASLAFRTGTTQDFALLRQAGQRLLGWLHTGAAGDLVSVYLTSRPTEPLVAGERLTAAMLEDLKARVGALTPTNLAGQPRRALEVVAEDCLAQGGSPSVDVYVLSDFQRREWLALDSGDASVFEPLDRLDPEDLRVVLIATGTTARDNVALREVRLTRPQTVAGQPVVVNATVANYSHQPLSGVRVQIEVDGAPLPPVPVDTIAAGGTRTISAEVTFPDEGFSEVAVGVDTVDGLPADNTRRRVLPVKRSLRVCLVNGQPATDPVRDEVYFLRSALAPAGPFSSGIQVRTIDPGEIEATALDAFDCVALCNVAAPSRSVVTALERYVRRGGGLVFFLGEEVEGSEEYNRVFYADGEGLLPLPLKELCRHGVGEAGGVGPAGSYLLGTGATGVGLVRTGEHPVTAMFPAGGAALTENVHFRAYYRCGPASDTSSDDLSSDRDRDNPATRRSPTTRPPATTLAHFTDDRQSPALVERSFGRGRVLLFTSSIDLDWNDWARALDGSYVVTLLELVQYIARRGEDRSAFVAGDKLTLSLSPEEYQPSAVFRPPATADEPATEARARGLVPAVGEPVVLEGPVATQLGTYAAELTRRQGGVEARPLAVNFDARESNLTVARQHELDVALGSVLHEYVRAADAFQQDETQARRELWPAVLVALVTILMLEQALAWWFGASGHTRRWRRPRLTLFGRYGFGGGVR